MWRWLSFKNALLPAIFLICHFDFWCDRKEIVHYMHVEHVHSLIKIQHVEIHVLTFSRSVIIFQQPHFYQNWYPINHIHSGSETSKLERELKSFVDIAHDAVDTVTSSQAMEEHGLSFDKQAYKANREVMTSYIPRYMIRVLVFNATFNNISAISWRSVLLVEETGVTREDHTPAASH